jgi:Ni/Co efflux regulator RcnB
MKKLLTLVLALSLIACSSEEEQKAQQEQQINQQAQQIRQLQQQVSQQQAKPIQEVQQVPVQQPVYMPQPVQAPAPAPVIVQSSPQQHDSTMTDMLVGGLVGHAIGSAMNNNSGGNYSSPAPVVNRTYVTKVTKVYNQPKPSIKKIYTPKPAASAPVYRASNIGRYRK